MSKPMTKLPKLKMSRTETKYLNFLKNNIADNPAVIWYTIALEIIGLNASRKLTGILFERIDELQKKLDSANRYISELEEDNI